MNGRFFNTGLQGMIRTLYMLASCLLLATTVLAQDDSAVVEDEPVTYQEQTYVAPPPMFRAVPDSVVYRLKKQKDFAYANDPAYWKEEPPEERDRKGFWDYFDSFFQKDAVRIVMYGLLIGFFVFLIYRIIVVNNLFLFYRKKKVKNILEDDEGDIEDDNLDERISKAIGLREHRMAIRYMYLKALRLLNDRQLIRFHAQATNYEYVNAMNSHKMGNEFRFLTRIYDYVWYGEFAITNEQFDLVQKNFQHFYNAVK